MKVLFFIFFVFSFIAACDANNDRQLTANILDVSKYAVTLNGKPAVYIKFGETETSYCSLAVLKESVVANYTIEIQGSASLEVNVDLSCMHGNQYYAMSASEDTYIKLSVIDASDKKVVYSLSSKLLSAADKKYKQISSIELVVEGDEFKSLTQ